MVFQTTFKHLVNLENVPFMNFKSTIEYSGINKCNTFYILHGHSVLFLFVPKVFPVVSGSKRH